MWTDLISFLGALLPTDPKWRTPLAITVGAVPGALSRYYLGLLCFRWFGSGFPVGTFVINLSGSFLMGFFVTYILDRAITAPELRLLVAVGFLGSYTTFSTYALDTAMLLQASQRSLALFYWLGSAALGFLCLELGSAIARKLF